MYSRILTAVDPDRPDSWARSIPVSVALARCFGARLTLCAVVPDAEAEVAAQWSPAGYREMIEVARAKLMTLAAAQAGAMDIEIGTGSIWSGIVDTGRRIGADLIVLSSHKPEVKDYLLGANASRVVRHAACSVMVVRGES